MPLPAAGSLWRWSLRLAAHGAFIIHTRCHQPWIMNKYERGRLHEFYPICDMEVTTVYNTHGQSHCDNKNPWYTACDLSVPPLTTGLGTGSVMRCHAGGLSVFLSEPVLTVLLNESVQAAFSWFERVCRSIQMYMLIETWGVSRNGHKKLQMQTSAGQLFILTDFRVPTLSGNYAKPRKVSL